MFAEDIKKLTEKNTYFRRVLHTGKYSQIVAMNIPVGEEIGMETHDNVDQLLFFVTGKCEAMLNGEIRNVDENDVVFVPAGTEHNFKNTGSMDLKLFTIYAPPEHKDGTIHTTKKEAEEAEHHE